MMIAASDPEEYVPFGRQHMEDHPGRVALPRLFPNQSASILAERFSQVNIDDEHQDEYWTLRSCNGVEEELYLSSKTCVISSGNVVKSIGNSNESKPSGRRLKVSYTMEMPIKQALWTNFVSTNDDKEEVPMPALCIMDSDKITVYTQKGEEFIAPLQFKVASLFSCKYGLILERVSHSPSLEKSTLVNSACVDEPSLTTFFSLLHPLDEISPVLATKHGGELVYYMCDPNMRLLFTSDNPSFCLMYDCKTGIHSVWKLRRATIEEEQVLCGPSSVSQVHSSIPSMFSFNSVNNSTIPPSFRSVNRSSIMHLGLSLNLTSPYPSRANSQPNSPFSQSPGLGRSPLRNTPRATYSPSPSNLEARLGTSHAPTFVEPKPILPQLCIDFIWCDSTAYPHESDRRTAFLTTDLLGQEFLCFMVDQKQQLMCLKLGKTNSENDPEVLVGSMSAVSAVHAVPLLSLNMMAILDLNRNIVLFSGISPVGKVSLAGISAQLVSSAYLQSLSNSFNVNSPYFKRTSLLSSTRVGDDDFEVEDDLSKIDESRESNDSLFSSSAGRESGTLLKQLRDPVFNRLTIEYSDGSMFRFSLPEISSSPLVSECIRILKTVLQRDEAHLFLIKWYSSRNALGTQNISQSTEWVLFIKLLLGLLGYNIDQLQLIHDYSSHDTLNKSSICKKRKTLDLGTSEDWEALLATDYHHSIGSKICSTLGLPCVKPGLNLQSPLASSLSNPKINSTAPLFSHFYVILFALHLLYEELKLSILYLDALPMLARLLSQLANDLKLHGYVHHYWRDQPLECSNFLVPESQIKPDDLEKLNMGSYIPKIPPSIFEKVFQIVKEDISTITPFPVIQSANVYTCKILKVLEVIVFGSNGSLVNIISLPGCRIPTPAVKVNSCFSASEQALSNAQKAVLLMTNLGIKEENVMLLPEGVSLIFKDALQETFETALPGWSPEMYHLIGREDMIDYQNQVKVPKPSVIAEIDFSAPTPTTKVDLTHNTLQVLKLRWRKDQRVTEVLRMLDSSEPVNVTIVQRPEVHDHEFIEEQERHLYSLCTRTMALPVGRGMMELWTCVPVISEALNIPKLCLSGKVPPRGTTVELSHIEVVPNMNLWPLFHNGVAAALKVSHSASNIDSTWITFNKPKNGNTESLPVHAGFLMGLGLSGHLKNFYELNTYEYLTKCHEMISVGLLLGIAASKRGTMDVRATKMFSVHTESLLPPTSIELDLVQNIQVAALLGIGLLYQGTAHRHIAEVLLAEIGRPPGPEMENSTDREGYSLAAGLGLGLVVLGRGANPTGLQDLAIPDTLHYYMVGGQMRPVSGSQKEKYKSPSYQIREGDRVNNHVTAPGATLALGMMYFNTGNLAVAQWLEAPDSEYMLDFICPDLLLLRALAKGLILWDNILPSREWVEAHVPQTVKTYSLVKPRESPHHVDYETMSQAYCNIVAGACMAIGLKFAGSGNAQAFDTLFTYCKTFTSLSSKSISELAGKSTIETCINTTLVSLAMVMAGTGELEVIRICRQLRSRISQTGANSVVTYGSHLATHMALGLLFLGSGSLTLSTTPESVAALICAFYPRFPTHSNDNRYHLQAFRHLYVLAVEPRLVLPRDVDTGINCYAHLTVVYLDTPHYQGQSYKVQAPCLLPELNLLKEVRIEDDRYWPKVFHRDKNWDQLVKILKNQLSVGVKLRSGCLSYIDDPLGYRTLLAQTLSTNQATSWTVPEESILGFTSDPKLVKFVNWFISSSDNEGVASDGEICFKQWLSKLMYDFLRRDRLALFKVWILIIKDIMNLDKEPSCYIAWQIRLALAHGLSRKTPSHVPTDDVLSLQFKVDTLLSSWNKAIGVPLTDYLNQSHMTDVTSVLKLTAFLTYYGIPSQSILVNHLKRKPSNILELCSCIRPLGLSTSVAKRIWDILNSRS